MAGSMAAKAKKCLEKDLSVPEQTLLHMPEKSGPRSEKSRADLKKAGDAIAKKKGMAIKKEGSGKISKEEALLVNRAIEAEMAEVDSGKQKTFTSDEIKKEFGL
jgi:hypothetical protein